MVMPTDPALAALIAKADSLAEVAARRRSDGRPAVGSEVRRILDAAAGLMRAGGDVRIAAVVRTARVSNDAFYRAFRGKRELLAAVVGDVERGLLGALAGELGAGEEPVRACVRGVLAQASDPERAATMRAVLRHTPRPDGRLRTGLADLLTEAMAPQDALVAAGALLAVLEQHLWAGSTPTDGDAEHLTAYLLRR